MKGFYKFFMNAKACFFGKNCMRSSENFPDTCVIINKSFSSQFIVAIVAIEGKTKDVSGIKIHMICFTPPKCGTNTANTNH